MFVILNLIMRIPNKNDFKIKRVFYFKMAKFPLYDSFIKQLDQNCKESDLKTGHKEELIKNIKTIDKKGSELIYALIRTYQMHNSGNMSEIPFDGIKKKENIKFDLENFPLELRHLIYKFVKMHIQTMEEEQGRLNQGF